jgi:DNA-binding GntR family transcriptional regulator
MVLSVGEEEMTQLQDPGEHRALLEAVATRDPAVIRARFTSHFAKGQQVVERAMAAPQPHVDDRSRL